MKKIILIIALWASSLSAQTAFSYVDLYGEIQVNMIIANKCLEEVAYTRKVDGAQCTNYTTILKTDIYSRLLKRDFSDFDSANSFWTEKDWVILQNQMKKLVYLTNLINQFK